MKREDGKVVHAITLTGYDGTDVRAFVEIFLDLRALSLVLGQYRDVAGVDAQSFHEMTPDSHLN